MKKRLLFLFLSLFLVSSIGFALAVPSPCDDNELNNTSNYGIKGIVEEVECGETFEDQPCVEGTTNILQKCIATIKITDVLKGDYSVGEKINIEFDKMYELNEPECIPGSLTENFIEEHKIKYYNASGSCVWTRLTDLGAAEEDDNETEINNEIEDNEIEVEIEDNETEIEDSELICCHMTFTGAKGFSKEAYRFMEKDDCVSHERYSRVEFEFADKEACKQEIKYRFENMKKIIKERNKLRVGLMQHLNQSECPEGCSCSTSNIKCEFENGTRIMTIYAGNSGNVIVQVKGINASTNVTLYKSGEKLYGVFNGNQTREIMAPDKIREKIHERLKARLEQENITLNDDGFYEVQARKKARLFLIVPVRESILSHIDAETGEILQIKNPWWGFLAKDIEEDNYESP